MPERDIFSKFAIDNGLVLSTADVTAFPRDVAAPPGELERYALATLASRRADVAPVVSLFVSEQAAPYPPSIREVLWWLAADSWAVEHAGRAIDAWAGIYGFTATDPATLRLFRLHVAQADRVARLLGGSAYRDLLALYRTELDRS